MENEVDVLDELNKGACMGMDAIDFIIDKVDNEALKKELDNQHREYKEISEEINNLYPGFLITYLCSKNIIKDK